MFNKNLIPSFLLFVSLLVVFALYYLGAGGPFLLDDFQNLQGIAAHGGITKLDDLLRYTFDASGDNFSRSVARLSFATSDQSWPSWPYCFKLTNIAIHLMNGLLVALLLLRLLPELLEKKSAQRVALLCAMLWLFHPLHVSTTLYVVQRMTQLMVFFLLLSLIFYVGFLRSISIVRAGVSLMLAAICAVLSLLSKEAGAILLLLYPLLGCFFFKNSSCRYKQFSNLLSILFCVLFISVFIAACFYTYDRFEGRFYSLWQRLEVQGWVLAEYIRFILLPSLDGLSIFHDDVEWQLYSQGLGWKGLFWGGHILIGFVGWRFLRNKPVVIFGLLWFYCTHLIESTIIPLELMFEHRNYLASIGLLLIVAFYIDKVAVIFWRKKMRLLAAIVILAPLIFLSIQLAHRALLWSDHRILIHKWSAEHPYSLRAQYGQIVMLERDGFIEKSIEMAKEQELVFEDLVIPMFRVRVECDNNPDVDIDNKLNVEHFSEVNYSSGVGPALQGLIDSPQRDCINRQILNGELAGLIRAIETMPLLQSKSSYYAQYLDIVDDYYIANLQYGIAIMKREALWEVQPSIATALKLVELYILGGNFDQASHYLDWAGERNNQRWYVDSVATGNIEYLRNLIDSRRSFLQ